MTAYEKYVADLAPVLQTPDPEWSLATKTRILSDAKAAQTRKSPWMSRTPRRRALVASSALAVVLTGGAAFAVTGGEPLNIVGGWMTEGTQSPTSSAHGVGSIGDPMMVAKFQTPTGMFSVWYALSSDGTVCLAYSDASWDGRTPLEAADLEGGCGGAIYDFEAPDQIGYLTSPDKIGGFFTDGDPVRPILYGVAPDRRAVKVHVQGVGVDRILPLRPDSHGYGASLPEAVHATELNLTFLDADGAAVASKRWVAPVG